MKWIKTAVLCLLIAVGVAGATGNQPINTPPVNSSNQITSNYLPDTRTFLINEDADRQAAWANPFVVSGGLHSTSGSKTSSAIALEAYTSGGNRVCADDTADDCSQTVAIDYDAAGCADSDTAWVIASASSSDTLSNFVRVTGTNYFVDCTSANQPSLPSDSVWLMEVTLSGAAITAVTDLRDLAPYTLGGGNSPFVYSGCTPADPGSGLTIAAFPCVAFLRDSDRVPSLQPTTQSSSAITIPDSAVVWLAIHNDLTSTPSGCGGGNWSRVSNTHYLYCANATLPANPSNGLVFTKITVISPNIDTVTNFAYRSPQDAAERVHRVTSWGVTLDGSTDDATAFQNTIDAAGLNGNKIVCPYGTALISVGLDFTAYTGDITGNCTIKAEPGTTISTVLDFTGASFINWRGVSLDMGQDASTVTADNRADKGFYLRNTRDSNFSDFHISGIRTGTTIQVDGSSAVSSTASDGAKRLHFNNITSVAYAYTTVNEGAQIFIRSDFETGTGGGSYYAASNAVKVADYTVDAAAAYDRTTSDIYFNNIHLENYERVGVLNAKGVHWTNFEFINFYTRGFNLSPTVENFSAVGGTIQANSSAVNVNFACLNVQVSDITLPGEASSQGERHTLRTGYGSQHIRFSNITGSGNDQAQIIVEGAKDVVFDNVSINNYPGGSTVLGAGIYGGEAGNASSFETDNITISNSHIAANYGIDVGSDSARTGTTTVAYKGVRIINSHFEKTLELHQSTQPTGGQIVWIASTADHEAGSAQDLDTRAFAIYDGGNLNLRTWDTFGCSGGGADTTATFSNVYFSITERDGNSGDSTRMPNILAYVKLSGETWYRPLIYGIDWDVSDATAANGMINTIDTITPGNFSAGDTIAIQRIR